MRRLKFWRRWSHPQAPSARFCQSLEYPRATAIAGEPEQGKEALSTEGSRPILEPPESSGGVRGP